MMSAAAIYKRRARVMLIAARLLSRERYRPTPKFLLKPPTRFRMPHRAFTARVCLMLEVADGRVEAEDA